MTPGRVSDPPSFDGSEDGSRMTVPVAGRLWDVYSCVAWSAINENVVRAQYYHTLKPGYNGGQLEDVTSSICISCADWCLEWLKGEGTRVKRCYGKRI
jgi:hypothetical protein